MTDEKDKVAAAETSGADARKDASGESPASRDELPPSSAAADKPATKVVADKAEPARTAVTPAQWIFLAAVAGVTAALDLWSKAWAIRTLSSPSLHTSPLCVPPPGAAHYMYQRMPTRQVDLIRNYLDFTYAENCGGAWGLLHGAREGLRKPFFLLVTVGAVLFILHLYRSLEPSQRSMRLALPLVLGGAIGNLVDRIRLGYVVDFIHMHVRDRANWPTYNVADIAITVGIGLMLLEYVLGPRKAPAKAKAKPKPAAG